MQTFKRNGRWMTLEQATEFDSGLAVKNPEKSKLKKLPVIAKDKNGAPVPIGTPGSIARDGNGAPVKEPATTKTLEALKATCKAKGIKFHPASGVKKLTDLLEKSQ